MTPSLASVYDALITRAADPSFADLVDPIRERFVRHVGPISPPVDGEMRAATDAWFEERSAALWDRVLTDRAVLARMPNAPEGLAHAQRGLFEVHATGDDVDLFCVATGAAFRLSPSDEAGRALGSGHRHVEDDVAPGLIDGHVVPTIEGITILPGILVHPAEATPLVLQMVDEMENVGVDVLDELLSMRHRLASSSRMKAKQVYRRAR